MPVVYLCPCKLYWLEGSQWICQTQRKCLQAHDSPGLMALALGDLVVSREESSQQQSLDMLIRSDKYRFAWEHAGKKIRGRDGHTGPSLSIRALGKKEQRSFQLCYEWQKSEEKSCVKEVRWGMKSCLGIMGELVTECCFLGGTHSYP